MCLLFTTTFIDRVLYWKAFKSDVHFDKIIAIVVLNSNHGCPTTEDDACPGNMFGISISFKSDWGPPHTDRSSDALADVLGIGDGLTLVARVVRELSGTAMFPWSGVPFAVAKIKRIKRTCFVVTSWDEKAIFTAVNGWTNRWNLCPRVGGGRGGGLLPYRLS